MNSGMPPIRNGVVDIKAPHYFTDADGRQRIATVTEYAFNQVWESEGGRQYLIVVVDYRWGSVPIIARRLTPGFRCGQPVAFDTRGQEIDGNARLIRRVS